MNRLNHSVAIPLYLLITLIGLTFAFTNVIAVVGLPRSLTPVLGAITQT